MAANGCEGNTSRKLGCDTRHEHEEGLKYNHMESSSTPEFRLNPNVNTFSPPHVNGLFRANHGIESIASHQSISLGRSAGALSTVNALSSIPYENYGGYMRTGSAYSAANNPYHAGYTMAYNVQAMCHGGPGSIFQNMGQGQVVQPPPVIRRGILNGRRVDFRLTSPHPGGYNPQWQCLAKVTGKGKSSSNHVTYCRGAKWHCWTVYHLPVEKRPLSMRSSNNKRGRAKTK